MSRATASFPGRKAGELMREKPKYTLNLVPRSQFFRRSALTAFLGLVLTVLFVCLTVFGILRPLRRQTEVRRTLEQTALLLDEVSAANRDYAETAAAYEATAPQRYRSAEELLPDRLELLSLVKRTVLPRCTLLSLHMEGTSMRLRLGNLDLEEAGALTRLLTAEDLVESATISGAGAASEPITLTVTIRSEEVSR